MNFFIKEMSVGFLLEIAPENPVLCLPAGRQGRG